jgi:pyrimidine deaminase RibD-like protein
MLGGVSQARGVALQMLHAPRGSTSATFILVYHTTEPCASIHRGHPCLNSARLFSKKAVSPSRKSPKLNVE